MKELEGKRVSELYLSDGLHFIKFITDEGEEFVYEALADCCSESWFHHVLGADALLGNIVKTAVEFPALAIDENEFTRQAMDLLYKVMLMTDQGFTDIEFRNSSNGYYSGWLALKSDGIPQYYRDIEEWRPVTADFTEGL